MQARFLKTHFPKTFLQKWLSHLPVEAPALRA